VSTQKKSVARMPRACARRNCSEAQADFWNPRRHHRHICNSMISDRTSRKLGLKPVWAPPQTVGRSVGLAAPNNSDLVAECGEPGEPGVRWVSAVQ
jgi:hypothetical protein